MLLEAERRRNGLVFPNMAVVRREGKMGQSWCEPVTEGNPRKFEREEGLKPEECWLYDIFRTDHNLGRLGTMQCKQRLRVNSTHKR